MNNDCYLQTFELFDILGILPLALPVRPVRPLIFPLDWNSLYIFECRIFITSYFYEHFSICICTTGTYCGRKHPTDMVIENSHLQVVYHTASMRVNQGFAMHWSTVTGTLHKLSSFGREFRLSNNKLVF